MTLSPHISILLSPPAFIALLILGSGLIYIAGKLEHAREVDEVPLVVLSYYDEPKPKHRKTWFKIAVGIAVATVIVAVCVGLWFSEGEPRW